MILTQLPKRFAYKLLKGEGTNDADHMAEGHLTEGKLHQKSS
jgi:hypothetical protein